MKLKKFSKKTINATIIKKMDDWLSSIKDISLKEQLRKDIIVTGGCIPSMMRGEKINDFDIYIKNIDTLYNVIKYYTTDMSDELTIVRKSTSHEFGKTVIHTKFPTNSEMINSDQHVDFKEIDTPEQTYGIFIPSDGIIKKTYKKKKLKKYLPVFLSENAITLSNKIQIIIRFWGEPEVIHKNYDFKHATNYWTYDTGVVMSIEANEEIRMKHLNYIGSKYPLSSLIRMVKFLKRGWKVNISTIVKICINLNDFDLTDQVTLKDQLTGVDLQYFEIFFNKIAAGENIDTTYLMKVMDDIMEEER